MGRSSVSPGGNGWQQCWLRWRRYATMARQVCVGCGGMRQHGLGRCMASGVDATEAVCGRSPRCLFLCTCIWICSFKSLILFCNFFDVLISIVNSHKKWCLSLFCVRSRTPKPSWFLLRIICDPILLDSCWEWFKYYILQTRDLASFDFGDFCSCRRSFHLKWVGVLCVWGQCSRRRQKIMSALI